MKLHRICLKSELHYQFVGLIAIVFRGDMILFAADNHYGTHAGQNLFECLRPHHEIHFHEDNWQCLMEENLGEKYDLLMFHLIGGTCNVPAPGPVAEQQVKKYLQAGKPMLLLHGSSAAFWQSAWWRSIVGFRWVRKDDPDGFAPSSHPIRPYLVEVAKSRHTLCQQLQDVEQPSDEIYINLEQSCPATTLMKTTIEEGTFPMAYETITPWGGKIVSYLPGHAPAATQHPGNVSNCRSIIEYLITPT